MASWDARSVWEGRTLIWARAAADLHVRLLVHAEEEDGDAALPQVREHAGRDEGPGGLAAQYCTGKRVTGWV